MKTVIFKWNPAFSSYSMFRFLEDLRILNEYDESDYNWSVWDYDKIHKGDRFYWVKVGMYGQVGIAGCGKITSEPYESEDWSGQGRKTYYVDFIPDTLLHPDALPILTCDELKKTIPDFEWNGGHSGLVLTDEQAVILDDLWASFVRRNAKAFEKAATLDRGDGDLIYSKKFKERNSGVQE